MNRNLSAVFLCLLVIGIAGCRLSDTRPVFVYRSGPVATLDPAAAMDHVSVVESSRAYQTPMRLERTLGTLLPKPWLLQRRPRISDGGRRVELVFRKGVRFQKSPLFDGASREVTACDWVKSLLRHADPSVDSQWKPYLVARVRGLLEWTGLARKKGVAAYSQLPAGLTCAGSVATVELRAPDPEFSYFLSHPASSVLPVDELLIRRWDVGRFPVGTGAFRLADRRADSLVWESVDSVNPLRGIRVDLTGDASKDWARMKSGTLDIIELPRDVEKQVILGDGTLAPVWSEQGYRLQRIQRSDLVFIGFQHQNPILGSKRGVRQALGLALKSGVVAPVFGGRAFEAGSAIPPGIEGHVIGSVASRGAESLAKARDLLGFNHHAHGKGLPSFRMGCLAHSLEQQLCRAVAARWKLLGITTIIETIDEQERRQRIQDGTLDFWVVTWVADLPGPISMLEIFDAGREIPEIPSVRGELRAFRAALSRARTGRGTAPSKAVAEAVAILNREAPAAFLAHRFQYWMVRPGIYGLGWGDFSWHAIDELRKLDSRVE